MDCKGAWHILIFGNLLTNCGDGIGSDGNGDMIVANNVMYNFSSVGFLSGSATGKAASQTIVSGNTIFLGQYLGPPQPAISIVDAIPATPTPVNEGATATPGSVVIANNVIYGSAYNTMLKLNVLGATVFGNVFDFGGVQPQNQPSSSMGPNGGTTGIPPVWPAPNGSGIQVSGNDIVIEGNMFRNAGQPGVPNPNAVGISFPSGFPPTVTPDTIRVLVKGNVFDKTIRVPIQDNSSGTDGLLGVRILDNIGVNPVGTLNSALVPIPPSVVAFVNPYPYDCFLNVTAGSGTATVALYGVTFASITTGQQKSFLVKAGGTITLTYTGLAPPSWVWVGL